MYAQRSVLRFPAHEATEAVHVMCQQYQYKTVEGILRDQLPENNA